MICLRKLDFRRPFGLKEEAICQRMRLRFQPAQAWNLGLPDVRPLAHSLRIDGHKVALLPDISIALRELFHAGSWLLARRANGGAVLVNAANVERLLYYPRSPVISSVGLSGVWPAQKLAVYGAD